MEIYHKAMHLKSTPKQQCPYTLLDSVKCMDIAGIGD